MTREEQLAKRRERYQKNKDKIKVYRQKHYQEHKEDYLKHNHKYYAENKETVLEKQREYNATHRASINKAHKKIYDANKEREHAYRLNQRMEIKKDVLTHYGNGKCACVRCGYSDIRALSIDHINGNGAEQRKNQPKFKDSRIFYRWLRNNNYPDGYSTLCLNCNWIKRYEMKESNNATKRYYGNQSTITSKQVV